LRYNAAHARQNTAWFYSPQNRCSLAFSILGTWAKLLRPQLSVAP
jgi:hypothetical protein